MHLGLTTTGDGIISALQVLSAMSKTDKSLAELKSGMNKYPQVLINITTTQAEKVVSSRLIQKVVKDVEQQLGKQGRVLLRPSGTEPVVRVMVEGEHKQLVQVLASEIAAAVKKECM